MTSKSKPAMNPTVEDEANDTNPNPKDTPTPNANETVAWSEIFSRHEAVLCSHLEMLSMVKEQIAPDLNGLQTVSSMVNKTVLAMNQLKVARKHMMSKNATPSISASSNTTQSTDTEANTHKKRRRVSRDKDTAHPEPTDEMRAPKRYRDSSSQPTPEQEEEYTSISLGTEDISAEVQRRLKIKEEQRLKRENPKADKRKRESLVSNEGESSVGSRPRKKRLMIAHGHKRHGDLMDNDMDSAKKKRRRSP
ncbi:uncharacterized protein N7479_011168 [Penicillium vulpinum]|uniref:Uncharacterized protein n=1 Tax=Penicillium vulpinum TaxID=29845 RepID=A0A1V6RRQ8_9EURO|nr:uncharacterized protein N7479_011168 [Penicillium vulpinum]KAJ5952755.1 hypothetical protein N7479_011168 [Penicillium vulpinum]OQE04451.1 hypothetical protein PENVUL_c033G02448 [Penicillium vulpinum]